SQLGRRDDLELRVGAVAGVLVVAPAPETRVVAEPSAEQTLVLHFADALDAERLPRHVLVRVPAVQAAGQPLPARRRLVDRLGPVAPRVPVERVLAQRLHLLEQLR